MLHVFLLLLYSMIIFTDMLWSEQKVCVSFLKNRYKKGHKTLKKVHMTNIK
jgi:hypothetical protein